MLRVGLTGGIGSGKSTVAGRLVEHGAVLIDADVLAREAVTSGSEGLSLIRERFGDSVIAADGELDRPGLGRVVFGDERARQDLNAIVHPRVHELTEQRMAQAPADAVVVHDIPLLVELDRGADYHLVVVVGAAEDVRLRRLIEHRGMSKQDARARIGAQADDSQRRAAADVWLSNEADRSALRAVVDALWSGRLTPFDANLRARRPARGQLLDVAPADTVTAARLLARVRRQLDLAGLADRVLGDEFLDPGEQSEGAAADAVVLRMSVDDASLTDAPDFQQALLAAGFAPRAPGRPDVVTYRSCDPGRAAELVCRHPRLPS